MTCGDDISSVKSQRLSGLIRAIIYSKGKKTETKMGNNDSSHDVEMSSLSVVTANDRPHIMVNTSYTNYINCQGNLLNQEKKY